MHLYLCISLCDKRNNKYRFASCANTLSKLRPWRKDEKKSVLHWQQNVYSREMIYVRASETDGWGKRRWNKEEGGGREGHRKDIKQYLEMPYLRFLFSESNASNKSQMEEYFIVVNTY